MFDLNDLPPPRKLPLGVRAEARRRLAVGISDRPARPARTGMVVAVAAAAVAVTAVGIPMLTGASPGPGPGGGPVTSSPPVEQDAPESPSAPAPRYDQRDSATAEDAQRCAADGWKPLFTSSSGGVTLVTLRSGGKLRFCELTPETVALSAPAGRPASGARITYVSANGTVAGVVADGEKYLSVKDPKMATDAYGSEIPAEIRDGAFVIPNGVTARPPALELLLGMNPTAGKSGTLPAAVAPRKDRPQPTRTGLPSCEAEAGSPPLVDAHAWQAAAPVTLTATERVQTARYAGLLAFCLVDDEQGTARLLVTDGRTPVSPAAREAGPNPYVITSGAFYHFVIDEQGQRSSSTELICGLVLDDRVDRVTLQGGDQPISAAVTDGMFVLPGITGPHRYVLTLTSSDGATVATAPIGG
ncbi:hypothetical protein [Winogradskya humida]|uniref:Uncharacterized protein n=1 Tax=Winogradskya humida TaxID=113566 RepID=A0ABQ4A0V8_9ACTN|nr:hypothetical protein [Actinoplanes humidus]GIE24463.1 hypothetical protein Ahu01nite_075650 [Actinoplanes humidus]